MWPLLCYKVAEAEAAVSVNEEKWLVMQKEACACANAARRASGPPKPLAHCDMKVPGQLLTFCWAGCCIKAPL